MKIKGRKIRFDRLFIVLLIIISIVSLLVFSVKSLVSYFKSYFKSNNKLFEITEIQSPFESKSYSIDDCLKIKEEIEDQLYDLTCLGEFRLTAYCSCPECCGEWSGGPCYNGEMPVEGWTVAVDPDVIPLNSFILIDGHKYKCCDTGSAILDKHIDIYLEDHERCFDAWCNGYHTVYLIND